MRPRFGISLFAKYNLLDDFSRSRFNPGMSLNLKELMSVTDDKRDSNWEDQFLTAFANSNVSLLSEDPQVGPDQWPYLLVETTEGSQEPAQKILAWLATRGIGLAINPQKEFPDFVLTFGMIWNFKETGKFIHRQVSAPSGNVELSRETIQHAGTPTEKYLPVYVKNILREFFRDQGVLAPKILLISTDKIHYDLAFSVESMGNPPESEWSGIAEAISWFLPPHYSILLVSEAQLPEFQAL